MFNEELLVVLRQPQSTGSSRSICLAYSGLEGTTSVSYSNVGSDTGYFDSDFF